jgi:hypothetical protein
MKGRRHHHHDGTQFGWQKEEAIAALLTHGNIEAFARATGVAPNTLLKWQRLPEFQTAYREARRAAFRQAVARLKQGIERGPSESLAETTARAKGISIRECGRSCGCWRAVRSYRYS